MDPYGSFQWYCRYYDGRSCGDDLRQIMRWNNINIFKVLLIHKIVKSGCGYNDFSFSAKFRQILLHWGYELTEYDFLIYCIKNKLL